MWQIFTLPVWVIYQNFWFLWMFTVCATFFFIWCASCFLQRIYLSGFGLSFKSTWRRHGCHRNNANILITTTCERVRGRTCVWVCDSAGSILNTNNYNSHRLHCTMKAQQNVNHTNTEDSVLILLYFLRNFINILFSLMKTDENYLIIGRKYVWEMTFIKKSNKKGKK